MYKDKAMFKQKFVTTLEDGGSSSAVPANVSGFRPFDACIGEIELPTSICIVGVSGCGKTFLVQALLKRISHQFQAVYVFSGSKGLNTDYADVPPGRFFNLDLKKIKRIIAGQEVLIKRGIKKNIAILVDDFVGKFNTHTSKTFDQLATSARHRGITMIYLSQKINKLSPVIREACKYWFVIKTNLPSLEVLYENQTAYEKKADFVSTVKKMTSQVQYSICYINNQNPYGTNVSFLLPATL